MVSLLAGIQWVVLSIGLLDFFIGAVASPALASRTDVKNSDVKPATPKIRLQNPSRVEQLRPILRPDATRTRLYFGPFLVHGQKENTAPKKNQMDPFGIKIDNKITGFCRNCTVLYGKADTYYINGTRASIANGIYNHHALVLDETKRTLPWWLCDGQTSLGQSPSSGFLISGVDEASNYFTTPDGTFKSGYFIGHNHTQWHLNAELTNYKDRNQTVYVTAEVEFVQGKPPGYSDATISLLSVTGCKSPAYYPPHGQAQYNMTSPPFRMPRDGLIINGKGHLHDGGINIELRLNGTIVCDSRAIYGGTGSSSVSPDGRAWESIHQMTQCTDPIAVKKGDVLTITSVYDTTKHPLRQAADGHGDEMDEMGTFFLNFALIDSL